MSESKIESFQKKCLHALEVIVVGPLASGIDFSHSQAAILAVDGGVNHLKHYDLSIGDGDSSHKNLDIRLSPQKDLSDLALALELIPKECAVSLYGFWGERMDHQLTVLGELMRWGQSQTQQPVLHAPTGEKMVFFPKGVHEINYQGLFSLLSLYEGEFSLKGQLDYPLASKILPPLSSHLLSNRARGVFQLSSSVPLFIFFGESL